MEEDDSLFLNIINEEKDDDDIDPSCSGELLRCFSSKSLMKSLYSLLFLNRLCVKSNCLENSRPFNKNLEKKLKYQIGVIRFYETGEIFVDSLWTGIVLSLLIQATAYYFMYPDERNEAGDGGFFWSVLGIGSIVNMLCLRSVGYICFGDAKAGYEQLLASSLDSYYIWPWLLGLPSFFGVINAYQARNNTFISESIDTEISDLIKDLDDDKHSRFKDARWVILALLPDCIPGSRICFEFCQPTIKEALERIKVSLIYDERLTDVQRSTLINKLTNIANDRIGITQIKVLSVLADILQNIDVDNLSSSKAHTRNSFRMIKKQAFNNLKSFSKNYNSDESSDSEEENLPKVKKSVLAYFWSNYFLWNLGYPRKTTLWIPFVLYKSFKLYFTLMFYKSVSSGVFNLFNRWINENNCHAEGKIWKWMDIWENYTCSVCSDLPIFVNDIWTVEDCFRSYLAFPRTYEDLMRNIIYRENQTNNGGVHKKFNLSEITVLDLSAQYELFNQTNNQLKNFLSSLSTKLVSLKNISLDSHTLFGSGGGMPWPQAEYISYQDFQVLMNFVQQFQLQLDSLKITKTLTPDFDNLLSETVANSTVKSLKLSLIRYGHGIFENLSKVLLQSSVTSLDFDTSRTLWNDDSLSMLGDHLPATISQLGDLWIKINSSTVHGCQRLADQLLNRTALNKLRILFDGRSALNCYMAFANTGKSANPDFYFRFFLNWQNHDDISILSKSLSNASFPTLKSLNIGFDASFMPPNETILLTLFESVTNSSLQEFGFSALNEVFLKNMNQSKVVNQLVDSLNHSNISRLNTAVYWGDEAGKNFAKELSKLSKIKHLHFDFHPTACEGPKAILSALLDAAYLTEFVMGFDRSENCTEVPYENIINTNIEALDLDSYNYESEAFLDTSMNQFLKKLNQSKIVHLDLGITLDETAMSALSEGLSGSLVEKSWLAHRLTDQNAEILARGLVVNKMKHGLWIDWYRSENTWYSIDSNTNLTFLIINSTDVGILAICQNLPHTQIARANFYAWSADNDLNYSVLENCGVFSSANALHPPWPYLWIARTYIGLREKIRNNLLMNNSDVADDRLISDRDESRDDVWESKALAVLTDITENHTSFLFIHLQSLCDTFLRSVKQSAWMTAIPLLVGEILSLQGNCTGEEIEKFSEELQTLLLVGITNSPSVVMANLLVRWIGERLNYTPQDISKMSIGISLMSSILMDTYSENASFKWSVLQAGTALMGSVLGSVGIQKLPEVMRYGLQQASRMKDYIYQISFWSSPVGDSDIATSVDDAIVQREFSGRKWGIG